jgi:DNA-binding NtrC family response regulator
MPPLRERRSDIPRLAAYFSRKAEARYGKPVAGMSSGARNCILRYDWPGNVRQLQNAIEHAVINAETDTIGVEDLPTELIRGNTTGDSAIPRLYDAINEATKRILLDAVRIAKGKVAEAAGLLGIHPNNLHRLINRYGLKDDVEKIRRDIY